jgi:hypothetical protein
MLSVSRLATPLSCLLLGTAFWVSRATLDQVFVDGVPTRLALLPGWHVWLGFALLAAMGAFALHRAATHPRRGTHIPRATFPPMLLPVWGLAFLLVPFLPWLADVWPALQVLAGPLRWIVWMAVAGQVLWVLWQDGLIGIPRRIGRLSLGQAAVLVWLVTALAASLSARHLTSGVLFPGGDEPHYLVIAQSLWRDGDLKIENNHERGDYLEYFDRELAPHFQTRGTDGEIYSIHPVGMPALIAPVYAAGGYPLVVLFFVLVAAATAAWLWRATVLWLGSTGAAAFGWAAVISSAPFLLNSFTIYPEVFAGLAVAVAFSWSSLQRQGPGRPGAALAVGLAIAVLPWLSTKYAPMSAALAVVALGRIWIGSAALPAPGRTRWTTTALVVLPYTASLALWLLFFQIIWGSPWPQASYAEAGQTSLAGLPAGVGGLLFDQEYGLLPVAPVFLVAFAGLWTMAVKGGDGRRVAGELILVAGAMVATVGAFHHWWGGSSVVGRNLVSVIPLLMIPIAVQFAAVPAGSARRAAQHLLVWVGAAITLTLAVAQEGLLLAQARDGSASLLEWLSPRWELWSLAPSFIHHDAATAWLYSLTWLLLALVAAWLLARVPARTCGGASLAALVTLGAGLAVASVVLPLLPGETPPPEARLDARSRLPALDGFDAAARPVAITYTPFSRGSAEAVVPLLTLGVRPDQRLDPQPLRVIHNGRLSLPAGVYDVEVAWVDRDPLPVTGPTTLGIQVGRTGPPWRRREVVARAGGMWSDRVHLAVDAAFFGLRGSLDVERAIAAITVRPVTIVNAGARPRVPQVLGGADYGETAAYFHDEQVYSEPTGFWTRGGREAVFTVAGPAGVPLALRIHSGGVTNRVVLGARDWTYTLDLTPGDIEEVALPAPVAGVLTVTLASEHGYVPSEISPDSADTRTLGVWVEVGTRPGGG